MYTTTRRRTCDRPAFYYFQRDFPKQSKLICPSGCLCSFMRHTGRNLGIWSTDLFCFKDEHNLEWFELDHDFPWNECLSLKTHYMNNGNAYLTAGGGPL